MNGRGGSVTRPCSYCGDEGFREGHCPSPTGSVFMNLPKRKSPRIPRYDYSLSNYYFITICTHEKKCLFGKPGTLNLFGQYAEQCIQSIPLVYPEIELDKYVIMPNHVHAILVISGMKEAKSISTIIGQYKIAVTKKIREIHPDMDVWQRSFHDHVIRNQAGYEKIWQYIENNPVKWEEDCFYHND